MYSEFFPPTMATQLAWAQTGMSSDVDSKNKALQVEHLLKDIVAEVLSKGGKEETRYVKAALAAMKSTERSLDIAYKGRALNFRENAELRETNLAQIEESLRFGSQAKDFLKSLPAMTITGAGGLTVAEALNITGVSLWVLGLGLAGLGYVVNLGFVAWARRLKCKQYIQQDYERNIYYNQYITRVKNILESLYLDLCRLHKTIFGQEYHPPGVISAEAFIHELLSGVTPVRCKHIVSHMRRGIVTPKLWPLCETEEVSSRQDCPHWR